MISLRETIQDSLAIFGNNPKYVLVNFKILMNSISYILSTKRFNI